jgi:hypothetical protein
MPYHLATPAIFLRKCPKIISYYNKKDDASRLFVYRDVTAGRSSSQAGIHNTGNWFLQSQSPLVFWGGWDW